MKLLWNRRSGVFLAIFLSGAGTYEMWHTTATRDRPWHLQAYVDVLAAQCRTAPGAGVFTGDLNVLAAQLESAKLNLMLSDRVMSLRRDYSGCVLQLLGAAQTAQRILIEQASRLREERFRLDVLLNTIHLEMANRLPETPAAARYDVQHYSHSRARTLVDAARKLETMGQTGSATIAALRASAAWAQGEDFVSAELSRFYDAQQRALWDRAAQDLLRWTRQSGSAAILVDKLEHRCLLLENGTIARAYSVNLGRNWYRGKVQEHDASTPEGDYRIRRKFRSGAFGWALLLDYPNAADRRKFETLKRSGEIGARARIGGNIEIHGGGRSNSDWTDGCVSLANDDMQELYQRAYVGMPVTIVGTSALRASVRR